MPVTYNTRSTARAASVSSSNSLRSFATQAPDTPAQPSPTSSTSPLSKEQVERMLIAGVNPVSAADLKDPRIPALVLKNLGLQACTGHIPPTTINEFVDITQSEDNYHELMWDCSLYPEKSEILVQLQHIQGTMQFLHANHDALVIQLRKTIQERDRLWEEASQTFDRLNDDLFHELTGKSIAAFRANAARNPAAAINKAYQFPKKTIPPHRFHTTPKPITTTSLQQVAEAHDLMGAARTLPPSQRRAIERIAERSRKRCIVCKKFGHVKKNCFKFECRKCKKVAPGHYWCRGHGGIDARNDGREETPEEGEVIEEVQEEMAEQFMARIIRDAGAR